VLGILHGTQKRATQTIRQNLSRVRTLGMPLHSDQKGNRCCISATNSFDEAVLSMRPSFKSRCEPANALVMMTHHLGAHSAIKMNVTHVPGHADRDRVKGVGCGTRATSSVPREAVVRQVRSERAASVHVHDL